MPSAFGKTIRLLPVVPQGWSTEYWLSPIAVNDGGLQSTMIKPVHWIQDDAVYWNSLVVFVHHWHVKTE